MAAAPCSILRTSTALRVVVVGLVTADTAVAREAIALVRPNHASHASSSSDEDDTGAVVGTIVTVGFIIVVVTFVLVAIRRSRSTTAAVLGGASVPSPGRSVMGRALVLSSSPNATGTTVGGVRFERRTMTLDIQLPNAAAYVVQGSFLVPRGITDALPGSSLEVSVSINSPQDVTVLGPGGFTGPWLRPGPPQAF